MSEPIFGFRAFDTEDSFIAWQKETPRKIYQVSPLMFSMGTEINDESQTLDSVIKAGCFVIYNRSDC